MTLHGTSNNGWLFVSGSVHLLVCGRYVCVANTSLIRSFMCTCGCSWLDTSTFVAHYILIMWTWNLPPFIVPLEGVFIEGQAFISLQGNVTLTIYSYYPDQRWCIHLWIGSLRLKLRLKYVYYAICL